MNPRKTAALLSKTPAGQAAMAEALGLKVAAGDDLPKAARVAILVPAYRGICTEVQLALKEMESYSSQFCTTERIELSKPIIHSCRNKLASLALDRDATHLLWCDDDMLPPPEALVTLLRHEKDIVGGLFTTRREPAHLVASMLNEEGEFEWLREAPFEGLRRVDSCGTGFTLVARRVMENIANDWVNCSWESEFWEVPSEVVRREQAARARSMEVLWFRYLLNRHGQEVGEDLSFFLNAKRCGFEVYVDCSVRVGHLGQKVFLPNDLERPDPNLCKTCKQHSICIALDGWGRCYAHSHPLI